MITLAEPAWSPPVDPRQRVEGERDGASQRWCIITPEYPPLPGSIGDHSFRLAAALTAAGDEVELWIPPGPIAPPIPGVIVHVLPSNFRLDALRRLRTAIRELPAETRVLVQYAPTAFGMRGRNVPFALLLYLERHRGIDLYFHGGGHAIRWRQPLRESLTGLTHHAMTWLAVQGTRRVFVSAPEWQRHLRRLGVSESDRDRVVTWVPVPGNVPDHADPARVAAIRATVGAGRATAVIGHYGKYGPFHQRLLPRVIERVLDAGRDRTMLLVGFGSGVVRDALAIARPDLAPRVIATGHLEAAEVSAHLAACDLLLQPYDDGASVQHASLMAGLALGCAVVTNRGPDTEAIWTTRHPVWLTATTEPYDLAQAVQTLLEDPVRRTALALAGRALHEERFAMSRGIVRLRNASLAAAPADEDDPVDVAAIPLTSAVAAPDRLAMGTPRVLLVPPPRTDGVRRRQAALSVHALATALEAGGAAVTVASDEPPPADARYLHRSLPSHGWRAAIRPLRLAMWRLGRFDLVHDLGGWRPLWRRRIAVVRSGLADGVDCTRLQPTSAPMSGRVLFVGPFAGDGRGHWLYELFREQILPRHPGAELHLVSDVAPPSHPSIRFDALGGGVDLAAVYRDASLLAAPAIGDEPDQTLLEAMASGLAVVATPAPHTIELLGNGRFGVIADDAVFADAIVRLLDDAPTARRLAVAARARAEEHDWPRMAQASRLRYAKALAQVDRRPVASGHPLASDRARTRGERDLRRALATLLGDASAMVDVGAGAGDATRQALAVPQVQRVIALEPIEHRRRAIRRALTASGWSLEPRLELAPEAVGAATGAEQFALDDLASALPSPVVVRVASPGALEPVLAGAAQTLDRQETRWLVAVAAERRDEVALAFSRQGYTVTHLRTRRPLAPQHWIAARR
jgi:glycosyltransferase involved in cell wall biosynthesis/precorrin-6B methylase 2